MSMDAWCKWRPEQGQGNELRLSRLPANNQRPARASEAPAHEVPCISLSIMHDFGLRLPLRVAIQRSQPPPALARHSQKRQTAASGDRSHRCESSRHS